MESEFKKEILGSLMHTFTVSCFSTDSCLELEYSSISASGRLNPVLSLDFQARAMGAAKSVFTSDLWIEIRYQNEPIGRGKVPPAIFGAANTNQAWVPIPVTHRSLDLITNSLSGNVSSLGLEIKFTGSILIDENMEYSYITRLQSMTTQFPKLGEYCLVPVSENPSGQLTIERTTWYGNVLAPTRHESYHYLEVALPSSPSQTDLKQEFLTGLNHLREAEKLYAQGTDDAVFHKLRGWLDSLPGAKQNILAGISDKDKRDHLDALIKAFGEYLHDGRHVSEEDGTFPVDHLDAAFALDMTRVLLSHLSLMLNAEERRLDNRASLATDSKQ